MASLRILPTVVAALCFVLAGVALATDPFIIEGRVYCDTCRAGFVTSANDSKKLVTWCIFRLLILIFWIAGAKVRLECKHFATGKVGHSIDGVTDETGAYKIELKDSHDEDICEVVLVSSPQSTCSEITAGRERARVVLTQHNGICNQQRYANPLGFLKEEPLPICGELLKQYALGDE